MTAATFALLIDGSTIEIRPATPQDEDAVREMHAALAALRWAVHRARLTGGTVDAVVACRVRCR